VGDHRATIKIEFNMHGVTSKTDLWINWWPGCAADGFPTALRDFFDEAEAKSMAAFHEDQNTADMERIKKRESLMKAAREKLTEDEWNALISEDV